MTLSMETIELKPGSRWRSAVCESEVVVVRAPASPVTLCIGGSPVLASGAAPPAGLRLDEALAGGTTLGKRYADNVSGLEVLCVRPGAGAITVDGRPAALIAPKQLPASD